MAKITVYETRQGRDLTEAQKSTVWNALRVARDRYQEDSDAMLKAVAECKAQGGDGAGFARLAAQFDRQARQADDLIETFE